MTRRLAIDWTTLPTVFDDGTAEAHRWAAHVASIVRSATSWKERGRVRRTALPCRGAEGRRPCGGRLTTAVSDVPGDVRWECPQCGEAGTVSNWAGSDADLSRRAPSRSEDGLREAVVSAEGYDELIRLDFPGSDRLVHGACLLDDEAALDEGDVLLVGRRSEFEELAGWLAGEANHARRGRRRSLLDALYEAIDAVA